MIRPLTDPDGRRAWAFAALLGGCVTMTLFAAAGVWLVRGDVALSFWLALAAHGQILVGLTMFGALFVKRTIRATRNGIEICDELDRDGCDVAACNETSR